MKFFLEAKAFSGSICLVEASMETQLDEEPPVGREFTHNTNEHIGKVYKVSVDARTGVRTVHLQRMISNDKTQAFSDLLVDAGFHIDSH